MSSKRLTVSQAHTICDSVKAKAVIVLALYEDRVSGASYGETKALCRQAGYTLDCIIDGLEAGTIPIWATAESEAARVARETDIRIREAIAEGY